MMNLSEKKSVGIIGVSGRMGRSIWTLLKQHPRFTCAGGFDRVFDRALNSGDCNFISLKDLFRESDYICDFSHPDLLRDIVLAMESTSPKPLLIGSTGHRSLEKDMRIVSKKAPVIIAPNTSIGAVIQRWVSGHISRHLPDHFSVDIAESHHCRKADIPSGTALALSKHVTETYAERGRSMSLCTHQTSQRSSDDIVIHAQRRGRIPPENTIMWTSEEEEISVRHNAFGQQETFARGALSVFEWIERTQPGPGLYTMEDILNLPRMPS